MAMRWVFGLAEVNKRYVSSRTVWPTWEAVPWTTLSNDARDESTVNYDFGGVVSFEHFEMLSPMQCSLLVNG
jgi:hypothetical protein